MEDAVLEAFGEKCAVAGAGRTDRGAHAEGQVAAFSLESPRSPDEVIDGLNEALPPDIRVRSVEEVIDDFHPRESAVTKTYAYVMAVTDDMPEEMEGRMWQLRRPVDAEAMREAAHVLVGRHDFRSFATKTKFDQKSTTREVTAIDVEANDELITLTITADGFLNHMVRNIVRALVKVGEGTWTPEELAEALAAKDRAASPGSAPAHGLYLVEVFYDED